MSIKVTNWVFEYSEATGNDRLVLHALAFQADDKGRVFGKPVSTFAKWTRLSEYHVRQALDRLQKTGDAISIGPGYLVLGDWE